MHNTRILIASDHAGFDLKLVISSYLKKCGYHIFDYGCFDSESVDYPDYAKEVCQEMEKKSNVLGVLICGTGIGMSIAANRFKHIRAALCVNSDMAKLAREHNDANILILGARIINEAVAISCVTVFLESEFRGGKYQDRLSKI